MDVLERILQLKQDGERFAVATVVSRKAPVSSQIGDKALVLENGELEGFIGGACSREIVRKQALEVLRLERPRLVRISPEPVPVEMSNVHDEICVPMTCASEGAVDVYIEPQVEKKRMLIAGGSPISVALAKQGHMQAYDVTLVHEEDEKDAVSFGLKGRNLEFLLVKDLKNWLSKLSAKQKGSMEAVVASMGHYDEEVLSVLVKANPRYLGLVSSQKRGAKIIQLLKDIGIPEADVDRVKNPAGLDLGASTPNEVAVSILAEMIQLRRQAAKDAEHVLASTDEVNCPVCDMDLDKSKARHSADYNGAMYYFCCPNCKHHFQKDPAKYLGAAA